MKRTVFGKFLLALCLLVCISLLICSCNDPVDPVDPTDTTVTYQVTVVDQDDLPLAGATVQLCLGEVCQLPVATDANGVATFELEAADYSVKVTLADYTGEESYRFGENATELTVKLTKNAPAVGTTADNPIFPEFDENHTAKVTVPAGATYYFASYNLSSDTALTANDVPVEVTYGAMRMPSTFSITNDTDADVEYTLVLNFRVGSMSNPEVIEDLEWYYGEISQVEGESQGYFYTYTAPANGTITFYFAFEGTPEGYECDIVINNLTTYAQKSLLMDGVDNYGLEVTMDVNEGDEIMISVIAVMDADGNYYPAADMVWTGNFTYPAGSEENPIYMEWEWDDEYTNATATVTVEAGETVYFSGNAGMILTVNEVVVEMNEEGVFSITNDGTEAAEYALALATPVGAYNNPEIITDATDFSDSKNLEAEGSYYYLFTAEENVTLVLDVTDGANITVDVLTYVDGSDWPETEQFVLAEPEMDDNWNYTGWTVEESLTIELTAGQQAKIQVNGLTDWSSWSSPAIEYTLTIVAAE